MRSFSSKCRVAPDAGESVALKASVRTEVSKFATAVHWRSIINVKERGI